MRPLIYLQIHRGHFTARRIGNGKVVSMKCAGLDHPRTLMGDIHSVESSFASAIKQLLPRFSLLKPRGLLHLVPVYEGGYTNVETRAFKEAGDASGVIFNHLSTLDRPHTDAEVIAALR